MDHKQFADRLRELHRYSGAIPYVNPEDKGFWRHTYIVYLETRCWFSAPYLVHADNEQDAYDEVCDYCDGRHPGMFADEDYINELIEDAKRDGREEFEYVEEHYTMAGNYGKWFANMCYVESTLTDKR